MFYEKFTSRPHQLKCPQGRKLKILIYARESTDEQYPGSVTDQVTICTESIRSLGIDETRIEVSIVYDGAISGEMASRPGIRQVTDGISAGSWDIAIAENASRFSRSEGLVVGLMDLAGPERCSCDLP